MPDYQKNILNDTLITSYAKQGTIDAAVSLINQKKHSKDSAAKKFIDTIITNHPTLLLSALDQLNPYLTEDVYLEDFCETLFQGIYASGKIQDPTATGDEAATKLNKAQEGQENSEYRKSIINDANAKYKKETELAATKIQHKFKDHRKREAEKAAAFEARKESDAATKIQHKFKDHLKEKLKKLLHLKQEKKQTPPLKSNTNSKITAKEKLKKLLHLKQEKQKLMK